MKLRIGSRGSPLALWQANHIAALLREQGHEVEIEIVKTTGDRWQELTLIEVGSKGMFTREIEEALAAGQVDLAVHSLKDLPTQLPAPFALAATPARADPRDVFVSVKYASLAELPGKARVGTSSPRRRAQLKALRKDVKAVEFRGNVDTRLRKLAEGQVEAILLAAAGLDRLGKTDWVRERLDPRDFCPAAGQGALAIETRKDDAATMEAVAFLDHSDTRFAVTAERAALAALGGGCQVPIGIHCRPSFAEDGSGTAWFEIFGMVASLKSGRVVRVHLHAPRENADPLSLGREAAEVLMAEGAGALLAADGEAAGGAD
jgi:hydroxymethylbilane synthase